MCCGLSIVTSKRWNTHRSEYSPPIWYAIRWDGNGFILVTKSLLDEMKFQWPKTQGEVRDISKHQLEWLLQGLQIDQKKAHTNSIDTSKIIF